MRDKSRLVISILLPLLFLVLISAFLVVIFIKQPKKEEVYTFKKDYTILTKDNNISLNVLVYTNKKESLITKSSSVEKLTLFANNFQTEVKDYKIIPKISNPIIYNDDTFYEVEYKLNLPFYNTSCDYSDLGLRITLINNDTYKLYLGKLTIFIDTNNNPDNPYFTIEKIIPVFSYSIENSKYRIKELKLKLNQKKPFVITKVYHKNYMSDGEHMGNPFYEIEENNTKYLLVKIAQEDFILDSIPLVFELKDESYKLEIFKYKNSDIIDYNFNNLFNTRKDFLTTCQIERVNYE